MYIWIVVRWNVEAWTINSKKISYCTVQCVHMGCHCACCCGFKSNLFLLYTTFSTLFQSINIGFDVYYVFPRFNNSSQRVHCLKEICGIENSVNVCCWGEVTVVYLWYFNDIWLLLTVRTPLLLLLLLFNFKVVSLWFKMLLHTRRVPTITVTYTLLFLINGRFAEL